MEILNEQQWLERLKSQQHTPRSSYRAMYSTWWQGVVTDPRLMLVPVDDHQVHRGDAVFEAMKARNGRIYLEAEHLDRLDRSAAAIALACPFDRARLKGILQDTLQASGLKDALLRLFLSRGPGSFSTNPYESVGAQVTLIVTELKGLPEATVRNGVSLALSKIPPKEGWQARVKSCNYLPNVLMKKEAVDLGVDFTVALTEKGELTEGSTENMVVVTRDGWLARPRPERILAGTTMMRAFSLARQLVAEGLLTGVGERDLSVADLREAREILMIGTTLDVVAATRFEGVAVGAGGPGPVSSRLREMILSDQS
ncbi:MAG: aminotransferase class IV [Bdellovibrionaceae bacterium]|nr:aminotransferase class IV [Pseudobdellovibrionaceae bacterium]